MTLARRIARTRIRGRLLWRWVSYWRFAIFSVSVSTAIIVILVLLIPALGQLQAQAKAGSQAKARQCSTRVAAHKVYTYMHSIRVINAADLAVFQHTAPVGCPK